MRRFTFLPALGLALIAPLVLGQSVPPDAPNPNAPAQPGGGLSNLIQPGTEDINAAYAVTPDAGLWMICAASYQGENAPELANKLCTYLRERHHPAYVFNRSNEERKKLQEELDQWQRANPGLPRKWQLAHPKEEQLAVLIGGFRDVDAASAMLKKVRGWDLPDIKLKSGKPAFDTYDVYEPAQGKKTYEVKRYPINPFHTAFVIRNPTIPQERKPVAKVDPFWKKLNADEPRSLFKCPKPWTLAVQEFPGAQVIQPTSAPNGFLEKLGFSDHHLGKRLDASAVMAQQVCDMFRKLGFKSYVLHTRTSSVVTVGEFNSRDDPELLRTQEKLSKFSFKNGSTNEDAFKLFTKALPMEVPH
jgi:cell division septation protein DedD